MSPTPPAFRPLLTFSTAAFLAACGAVAPAPTSPALSTPALSNTEAPTSPTSSAPQSALVLGGGGPVGQAWEIGILKGLKDAGVDPAQADVTVGTSAGSLIAPLLLSLPNLDAVYNARLTPPTAPAPLAAPAFDPAYANETQSLIRSASPSELTPALRIQVGQRALAAPKVIPENAWVSARKAALAAASVTDWPAKPLRMAAGDVNDGTMRFIDKGQGVPVERASAASSALPGEIAPITIGDRRYMDGYVGGLNIEGAGGAKLILVIAPAGANKTEQQADAARAKGSQVLLITPDAQGRSEMGTNLYDQTKIPATERTASRQAATVAGQVKALWSGASPD